MDDQIDSLKAEKERLDGVVAGLAGAHAELLAENEKLRDTLRNVRKYTLGSMGVVCGCADLDDGAKCVLCRIDAVLAEKNDEHKTVDP